MESAIPMLAESDFSNAAAASSYRASFRYAIPIPRKRSLSFSPCFCACEKLASALS